MVVGKKVFLPMRNGITVAQRHFKRSDMDPNIPEHLLGPFFKNIGVLQQEYYSPKDTHLYV
jgi:hypothetical protein